LQNGPKHENSSHDLFHSAKTILEETLNAPWMPKCSPTAENHLQRGQATNDAATNGYGTGQDGFHDRRNQGRKNSSVAKTRLQAMNGRIEDPKCLQIASRSQFETAKN